MIFIVCHFRGGPVAAFLSMEKAHSYISKQKGGYNLFEIVELEITQ